MKYNRDSRGRFACGRDLVTREQRMDIAPWYYAPAGALVVTLALVALVYVVSNIATAVAVIY